MLSVLNNELFLFFIFLSERLLPGHVGLLCFSLGFSDLSVIAAITGYREKCVVTTCAPDFKSWASSGQVDNSTVISSCSYLFRLPNSQTFTQKLGEGRKPFHQNWVQMGKQIFKPACALILVGLHPGLCHANPLSLLLCLLVFVLSPLCVTYAHACIWIIHENVMHECIPLCVRLCVCVCYVALTSPSCMSPCPPLYVPLCVCVCVPATLPERSTSTCHRRP